MLLLKAHRDPYFQHGIGLRFTSCSMDIVMFALGHQLFLNTLYIAYFLLARIGMPSASTPFHE